MSEKVIQILKFWFGDDLDSLKSDDYKHKPELWFNIKWETDELIKEKFGEILKKIENDQLIDEWVQTPNGSLALIIVLDQFSRNIYRGTADMFKNDEKALKLALKLIENKTEFKNFSLIEKFFAYLPLLHIEDHKIVKKSLEYIEEIVNSSPEYQKKKFEKYYSSSKVHYDLLVKYNRYPHRNALLERESTQEELEFLKRSKHNFVKSVSQIKKPLPSTAFQLESTIPKTDKNPIPKQKSMMPFQNILFLHGFRQNSNKLKKRLKKIINILKTQCNAHLTFLNGTHPYIPKGEIANQMDSTIGKDILNPIESQRVWFNSDDKAEVYYGIDESIDHVLSHVKIHGPYDGIIGFGQGAVLASIIVKKHPNLFRFLVNISAFQPRSIRYRNIFSISNPFDFPSLHIYGKNDILITSSRSEELAKCFKDCQIAQHLAGHFAPDAWPIDKLIGFIKLQADNLKPTKFLEAQPFELKIVKLNDSLLRFDLSKLNVSPLFNTDWSRKFFMSDKFMNFFNYSDTVSFDNLNNEFKNIQTIDDLNDGLLIIYLLLIKAKKIEANLENKNHTYSILKSFLSIYINYDDYSSYLLDEVLDILFVNSNSWQELVYLCDLSYTLQSDLNFSKKKENLENIYNFLINLFCKQILLDLSYIDSKNRTSKLQELTSMKKNLNDNNDIIQNEDVKLRLMNDENDEEHIITDLAKYLPRVKSAIDRRSRIARECANIFNSYKHICESEENLGKLNNAKMLSYNHYRKILSAICHFNDAAANSIENYNPRKYFNLAKYDKKIMEQLMSAPLSDAIINPIPEPVDISSYEQMKPLYDWLESNKLSQFNQEDLKFLRGTITSDGRLDLCKQVIGPIGIKPLLDSMKENQNVNRLLLGNNVVGDEAGKVIAEFIKSGKSPLTIWYIAGNNLTVNGITPITEALLNDTQVKALWLKRNPLKSDGMVPIAKLIRFNTTIQVLDLLNCGLLDEGVKILFDSLKENNALKHLYLSANGITPIGLEYINEYYKSGKSSLETLFLGCNRIGNNGAKIISEILKNDKKLIRLNLTSSRIGAEGIKYLAESLKEHPCLKVLDLGYMKATMDLGELGNYIEDEGASYLAKYIEQSNLLMWLNITHNHITQRGMQLIVDAIKMNQSILYLDYVQYGTSLNEITLTDLRNTLEKNRCLLKTNNPEFDSETIFVPEHVKEIYSVYRTH